MTDNASPDTAQMDPQLEEDRPGKERFLSSE